MDPESLLEDAALERQERERRARWGETVSAAVRGTLSDADLKAIKHLMLDAADEVGLDGTFLRSPEEEGARLLAAWKGAHA